MKNQMNYVLGEGKGYTSHSFRTGWASYASENGVPPAHIQGFMRHKNVNTSAKYWRQTDKIKVAEDVEKIFS